MPDNYEAYKHKLNDPYKDYTFDYHNQMHGTDIKDIFASSKDKEANRTTKKDLYNYRSGATSVEKLSKTGEYDFTSGVLADVLAAMRNMSSSERESQLYSKMKPHVDLLAKQGNTDELWKLVNELKDNINNTIGPDSCTFVDNNTSGYNGVNVIFNNKEAYNTAEADVIRYIMYGRPDAYKESSFYNSKIKEATDVQVGKRKKEVGNADSVAEYEESQRKMLQEAGADAGDIFQAATDLAMQAAKLNVQQAKGLQVNESLISQMYNNIAMYNQANEGFAVLFDYCYAMYFSEYAKSLTQTKEIQNLITATKANTMSASANNARMSYNKEGSGDSFKLVPKVTQGGKPWN